MKWHWTKAHRYGNSCRVSKLKAVFIAGGLSIAGLNTAAELDVVASPNATTLHANGEVLWTYHHDPQEGKPYFHPLNTSQGDRLSELRPKDHPWHRGLWFSWKYINGVNYWEEDRTTGLSDGLTRLLATQRHINESQEVTIEQVLDYAPTTDGPALLVESRRLVIVPPNASGDYLIDWRSEFRALKDLELDRTPILGEPGGKKYGGYAGLSIRLNKSSVGGTFLTAEGDLNGKEIQNVASTWMAFNTKQGGSILMMDHPGNFRSPTKWYVVPAMPYFSPAILFDAPHRMAAGESLVLHYRILVSAEAMPAAKAAAAFREWQASAQLGRAAFPGTQNSGFASGSLPRTLNP